MFEGMYISESIYEGAVEPLYKNPLGQIPTVMATVGKIEDNPPCHTITL